KHVDAIYALCRLADDIVDLPSEPADLWASTAPAQSINNFRASTGSAHISGSAEISNNAGASTGSAHIPTEPEPTPPDPEPIRPELDEELEFGTSTSSAHMTETSSSHISTVGRRL